MKARHKRFGLIVAGLSALLLTAGLVLNAFRSNMVFFYTPTQVVNGEVPHGVSFRIGGLVAPASLVRDADGLTVHFVVTDTVQHTSVTFQGILPDLFKEGKGVVAEGKLSDTGQFVASNVLAKHDENYMPPEAADAIKRANAGQQTSMLTKERL